MKAVYRLHPAFRHGADTPWGGDALRTAFGMDIPDAHTGEALIASTLPGYESVTDDRQTLTALAGGPLPLLLKLIDARETLSVQVHPDDAYASAHEGGKRGKTEAWLILHCEPGARLVYGVMPGTDVRALSGQEIETYLHWVEPKPGDVLYIPAGMVHAIGGGILLYEIQETSDVTYRFWDWGRPRKLHWEQARDVTRTDLPLSTVRGETKAVAGGSITRYLSTPFFTLDRVAITGSLQLPVRDGFQYVTALGTGTLMSGADSLAFKPGDTFYVPPEAEGIVAEGTADLIISAEGDR